MKEEKRGYIDIKIRIPFQSSLLGWLEEIVEHPEAPQGLREEAMEAGRYIRENLKGLKIRRSEDGDRIEALYTPLKEVREEDVEKHLSTHAVKGYLLRLGILELEDPSKGFPGIDEIIEEYKERLHKQPRDYLKTTARIVGRDTSTPSLFSLPQGQLIEATGFKEVISKNTAILGNLIIQLWQTEKNKNRELEIENLSSIGRLMGGVSNFELKMYFLYLGGYTYPIVDMEGENLTLSQEQLFKVKFIYDKEVSKSIDARELVGTNLAQFIKDTPVESIKVKPNEKFIEAIQGRKLGNVLVSDSFIKLALDLSDIAYKLLTYSASNKPSQKIKEALLIKHLNLARQAKTQGLPRVRATIRKGFEELRDKGHIEKWRFEERNSIYSFKYTDRFIKHSEFRDKDPEEAK